MPAHIHVHWGTLPAIETTSAQERKTAVQQRRIRLRHYCQEQLARYLARSPDEIEIIRLAHGKPVLAEPDLLSFNHSHSQQHYALAYSDRIQDIGVDVEDFNRQVRFEALARHAFHPEEFERWQAVHYDSVYWFKVWTTKEAVLKASGLGIRINLNELNTNAHSIEDGGMCQHPQIGSYAYQNIHLPHAMLTVAWSATPSCQGFNFPRIQLHSLLTNEHIA